MYIDQCSAQVLLKNIRVSPQKLNLVAQMIRGMNVGRAMGALKFSKKRVAVDVLKALRSAVANAENNHNLNVDALVVTEAFVGKGMCLKRFHPRGRSKGGVVHKPFSHLRIIVTDLEAEKKNMLDLLERIIAESKDEEDENSESTVVDSTAQEVVDSSAQEKGN